MICPKCNFEQSDVNEECVKCGIIFKKYLTHRQSLAKNEEELSLPKQEIKEEKKKSTKILDFAKNLFFYVNPQINPLYFGGRVFTFLLIFIWGWKFILTPMETNYVGESFMHLINLPFHEAGHIIFRPFGRFITVLGGTLGQLLIPLICFLTFLIKTKDTFAASVALWWFGQNFMDIAPYINDARELKLILLGGVTGREVVDYHDWEFILRKLGWLQYDHFLANTAYNIGILLMLITFVWGGILLFKQFKNIK